MIEPFRPCLTVGYRLSTVDTLSAFSITTQTLDADIHMIFT